jgi:hypothetical protein
VVAPNVTVPELLPNEVPETTPAGLMERPDGNPISE